MDKQVLERIQRISKVDSVIPGSTPVISFGDFTQSGVVTLSINPSSKEFLAGSKLIEKGKKRLVDFDVLGLALNDDISEFDAEIIWKGCQDYFRSSGNPYSWFDDLELILNYSNLSYKNGTVSHLDLVQSATFPAWSDLPLEHQKQLLDEDYDFFKYQMSHPGISAILINGRQVYEVAKKTPGFNLKIQDRLELKSGENKISTTIFHGMGPNDKSVFGWTGTLKSLQISREQRDSLYRELGSRFNKFLN